MPDPKPNLLESLNPRHSAVVEACAGSGKTWLLVSRMIRLLLAGAEASELLAITFTRKAAEEMRARLDDWLRDLALLPDEQALTFMAQRGIAPADAPALLPRARGLLDAVLRARPGPLITTFHGWFLHLLEHAPLTHRVGADILAQPGLIQDRAWLEFLESMKTRRGSPEESALHALLEEMPLTTVRALLDALIERRAEWLAYAGAAPDEADAQAGVERACAALAQRLGVTEDARVAAEWLDQPGLRQDWADYAALLAREAARLSSMVKPYASLETALAAWDAASGEAGIDAVLDAVLDGLCAAVLTQQQAPRALKRSGALVKHLGEAAADRMLDLHVRLAEGCVAALERRREQRALRLNRLGLVAGLAYLHTYQRLKTESGGIDFTDAEVRAARLLQDETVAGAVLEKLDARWKHILLDEFQDTNPLQWQALRAWLDAYGADAQRPTLFMVGDPKQSIYRFRRAEPRLFGAAAEWLGRQFQARHYPHNETRRCAPAVVAWVNAVFGERPDYPGFAAHTAHQTALPGWCGAWVAETDADLADDASADAATPDAEASADDGLPTADAVPALRLPLHAPPPSPAPPRQAEADWLADRILSLVGRLELAGDPPRRAGFGDMLVLYAKRADLDVFEAVFRMRGIPFVSDRRGALLDTLEARDLTALLTALADPRDNLALAHALKSPLFGWADADLERLSSRSPGSPKNDLAPSGGGAGVFSEPGAQPLQGAPDTAWRERLGMLAQGADAHPATQRADALLTRWQARAATLPVHDLLDGIYHEAQVSARYASTVPGHLRDSVLANLDAFLALSLTLSSGRYPSLPRFLDEIRDLRDKAGQDGPGEPPANDGRSVRMLTIHSAKGLEAPVVFVIKADQSAGKAEAQGVALDWPPEAERPVHFSLYGASAYRGAGRDDLLRADTEQAALERLNLLYVAMTRARQALFISGTRGPKARAKGEWPGWLAEVLPALAACDKAPSCSSQSPGRPTIDLAPLEDGSGVASRGQTPASHAEAMASRETSPTSPPPRGYDLPPIGVRAPAPSAAAGHGIALHAWLEFRAQGEPPEPLARRLGLAPDAAARLEEIAQRLLHHPELRAAFDPAQHRRARNELEVLDAEGRLLRIDRLVEFDDAVWVLDYKSGGLDIADATARAEPHRAQMAAYRAVAASLFPGKSVRCALAFADGLVHWL